MKKERLTCEIARNICIVQTLAKFGHSPSRKTEKEAWFLSPFRTESQASFKVDLRINRWFDHGAGKGGNVIDLIMQLKGISVKETLSILDSSNLFSFHQQPILNKEEIESNDYEVLSRKEISAPALIEYLRLRFIPLNIARQYCCEIHYKIKNKNYFAIAFKNNQKGFETRNKYFKGCLGKKAITSIENDSQMVCVFEGFFDFLSYLILYKKNEKDEDYIICNSTALVSKVIPKLAKYKMVLLCLDNDQNGLKCKEILKRSHHNVLDCSSAWKEFKDINECLIETRKNEKKKRKLLWMNR